MFLKGMSVIGLTSIDEMRYEQFLHSYEVEQSHESVLQSPTDDKFDDKVNMRKALQNSRWKILKLTNNPNRFKFAEDHGDKCKLYDFLSFKTSDFFSPTNKNLLLWSNMLMSHLLTHMCVVPDIQFKAFVCRNPFFSFDLDKISVNLDILSKKMQEVTHNPPRKSK
jgi:hypothetical protein